MYHLFGHGKHCHKIRLRIVLGRVDVPIAIVVEKKFGEWRGRVL